MKDPFDKIFIVGKDGQVINESHIYLLTSDSRDLFNCRQKNSSDTTESLILFKDKEIQVKVDQRRVL